MQREIGVKATIRYEWKWCGDDYICQYLMNPRPSIYVCELFRDEYGNRIFLNHPGGEDETERCSACKEATNGE